MSKYRYVKPVIGLAGGVGSGKSFVARALAKEGCGVIDSDALARDILNSPDVAAQLAKWWGPAMLDEHGKVDRKRVAGQVFADPSALQRLNGLIHPLVNTERQRLTAQMANAPEIRAIVWDSPLLFETGLNQHCDAVIFVKSSHDKRLARILATRGWSALEHAKRENLQISLDKKEKVADYVVDNNGEEVTTLHQVHEVLSRILSTDASRK